MDNLDLELERVIVPQGAKDHSQLQNLDYENSGHRGFASTEQLNATNEKVSTLEGQVQTNASAIQALSEGIDPEKIDGIKDLINYVEEHEVDVVSIQEGIEQNANDIDELEGKVTALEEKPSTPSGEPLVATFNTNNTNVTITVKNLTGATMVDWGDGSPIEDISGRTSYSHTYANKALYVSKFYGSITEVGTSAFETQYSLNHVIIPSHIESIGKSSFKGCNKLRTVQLARYTTAILSEAFYGCIQLNDINLNNIKVIYSSAFYNCRGLTNIIIDQRCAPFTDAFYGCSGLKSITFNGGADFDGSALPFNGCTNLKYVYLFGDKAYVKATGSFPTTAKIIVPYSELEAYKNDERWSTIASQIDAYAMASDIGNINTQLANIIEGEGV